jgi:hypothetical protein
LWTTPIEPETSSTKSGITSRKRHPEGGRRPQCGDLGGYRLNHGEAVKSDVTVGTELAGELPRIQCDQVPLQQVMLNLIHNGIQSMSGFIGGNP